MLASISAIPPGEGSEERQTIPPLYLRSFIRFREQARQMTSRCPSNELGRQAYFEDEMEVDPATDVSTAVTDSVEFVVADIQRISLGVWWAILEELGRSGENYQNEELQELCHASIGILIDNNKAGFGKDMPKLSSVLMLFRSRGLQSLLPESIEKIAGAIQWGYAPKTWTSDMDLEGLLETDLSGDSIDQKRALEMLLKILYVRREIELQHRADREELECFLSR